MRAGGGGGGGRWVLGAITRPGPCLMTSYAISSALMPSFRPILRVKGWLEYPARRYINRRHMTGEPQHWTVSQSLQHE